MLDRSNADSSAAQSPDVHFRETDVEFLKQQARIWLEAVLDERFDGETSLADILADGEILHRISMTIRSLLRKHVDGEPVSPKSLFPEAAFYGKHSGKYLPYSYVDAFLKVCQKLGLTGVDLFSPPDVVEKKDIRRVCLCIRALSKKARARQLEVPNFDYVTHSTTVTMPTELVDGLRDSLRQASASSSPSSLRSMENKETLEKVGLSPLRLKRSIGSGLSGGQGEFSSSEFSEEPGKEPARPLLFEENDGARDSLSAALHQRSSDSVIDGDTSPAAEEDSGFLSGSRGIVLSADDEKACLENFSIEGQQDAVHNSSVVKHLDSSDTTEWSSPKASLNESILCKSLDRDYLSSDPTKSFSEKVDVAQRDSSEVLPARRGAGQGNKDGQASKKGVWVPFMAAAMAMLGAFLVIKAREPSIYEVKKGDTLSEISRRMGKSSWEELVHLNPGIRNPDLIYPNERLRLHS